MSVTHGTPPAAVAPSVPYRPKYSITVKLDEDDTELLKYHGHDTYMKCAEWAEKTLEYALLELLVEKQEEEELDADNSDDWELEDDPAGPGGTVQDASEILKCPA